MSADPNSIADHLVVPQAVRSAKLYKRIQYMLRRQVVRRRAVRMSLLLSNVVVLAIILVFVLQNPQTTAVKSSALADTSVAASVSNPLDQLSSANIALTVARLDSLPETTAVNNQADSQATELATASTEDSIIAKPQVVATALKSRADIQDYVTQAGDTLSSLAVKFGVTSDSIRWSNGLPATDSLAAGHSLVIPPVNGIVYTVKAGDTAASLAAKYSANQAQIVAFNDAEISGLQVGEQVIIPDATQPTAKGLPILPAAGTWGGSPVYGAFNGYDFGYCTWFVANQRAKAGEPLPTDLGNASSWGVRARAFGLSTGTTPRVGAAVVTSTRGEGHVAYVTGVNANGSINVIEMNVRGWDVEDSSTYSGNFTYIY